LTTRHIAGLMGCLLALLVCAMLHSCGDHVNDVKEIALVIAGAIAGDANSLTKYRTKHGAMEQRGGDAG
jgi:hypothetical protein